MGLPRLTDFIPSNLSCPHQHDYPVRVPFTLYAYLGQRDVFHCVPQSLQDSSLMLPQLLYLHTALLPPCLITYLFV